MATEIADRITVDPEVMVGKPVIKGTRLPVELVLAKLAANPDLDAFFLDYPEVTVDDVKAALRYAATAVQENGQTRALAEIGEALREQGISLDEMIERGRAIRSQLLAEQYGINDATS